MSLQVDGFVLSIVIIVGSRILNAVLSKYQGLDFQGIVLVEPLTLLLWSNDYPLRDLIYIDHVTLRIAQSFRPVYSISCPSSNVTSWLYRFLGRQLSFIFCLNSLIISAKRRKWFNRHSNRCSNTRFMSSSRIEF